MTLADKLAASNYRPTGFDYMRIILACGIIVWHTIVTSYGPEAQDAIQAGPARGFFAILLPMFFSLSGFLVAGSLGRSKTLAGFLGLRVIRIFPALVVEVILSAFFLGPLLTIFTINEYFSDSKFYLYLLNIFGDIHYQLPGVFLSNPNPDRVNGQLWTVPFELLCYVSVAGLALFGLQHRHRLFVSATVALWLVGAATFFYKYGVASDRPPSNVPGFALVIAFLFGVWIFVVRERIVWSWALGAAALAVTCLLFAFPPYGDLLTPLPIAYLTVFLGVLNPRKIALLQGADYSYGVFLYGYVIQQAYMDVFPWARHWYINLALALPTAAVFAAFSWHCVEKPALRLRKIVTLLDDTWHTRAPARFGHLQARTTVIEH